MNPLLRRRLPAATAAALTGVVGLTLALFTSSVAYAVPATPHQMPFPCGQTWTGATRGSHTPSMQAIDWNRSGDEGDTIVASASGIVSTADATGTRGYGHHVVIEHPNGESSVYAHMDSVTVKPGQYVDQGAVIGTVGNTGNSDGPHLHFEERSGKTILPASFGGVPYFFGNLTSFNCVDVPIAADFTGDSIAEVAVYRRGKRSSFVVNEPTGARVLLFGKATDEPVVGDWDGNGGVNLGIWRPKRNRFRLQTPTGIVKVTYGQAADRPIAGDWNGDGTDQVGVYRSSVGTFFLRQPDGSSATVVMGDADDLPVTGDWDGNGITDLGVFDPATATFTLQAVDITGQVVTSALQLGAPGDLPVTGDWDGDGVTDVGVWATATATFTQGKPVFSVATPLSSILPDIVSSRMVTQKIQFGLPRG